MKKSDVALLRPVLSDNDEINENARAVARLKKTAETSSAFRSAVCRIEAAGNITFFSRETFRLFSGFSILPAANFPFTTATPPGLPLFVM